MVLTRDVKKGEKITKDLITFKRPGTGISPSDLEKVIGRKVALDLGEDTVLTWEYIN
ncbi:SAF domain-containing protein [Clostridium sp.]|uniref:SAF domain-containing protein n=1 Tax=Clostridium sp. TaxID=1506 RepID=UPI0032174D6A